MSFCIICFLRRLHRSHWQTNPEQQPPLPPDITIELEDSRKFSLNSLTTLLAILTLSRSETLQPVVLTLLIYTISLRLAVNSCFLRSYPTLSRFLHAIPLLGTSCAAGVVLVFESQSPALATAGLLLGVLPLVTIAIHHGRLCGETSTAGLPVRMEDVSRPAASGSANITPSD